jgi:hypothetical protein
MFPFDIISWRSINFPRDRGLKLNINYSLHCSGWKSITIEVFEIAFPSGNVRISWEVLFLKNCVTVIQKLLQWLQIFQDVMSFRVISSGSINKFYYADYQNKNRSLTTLLVLLLLFSSLIASDKLRQLFRRVYELLMMITNFFLGSLSLNFKLELILFSFHLQTSRF